MKGFHDHLDRRRMVDQIGEDIVISHLAIGMGNPRCSEHIDEDLRRLPKLDIPLRLVETLKNAPPVSSPGETRAAWTPELLRVLSYGIGAVIAFIAFGELPALFQALGNVLLAFTGTLVFLLSILRPIFQPGPSLPDQAQRPRHGDGP